MAFVPVRISFVSSVMVNFWFAATCVPEGLFVVMFSAVMVGCFVSCIVIILVTLSGMFPARSAGA